MHRIPMCIPTNLRHVPYIYIYGQSHLFYYICVRPFSQQNTAKRAILDQKPQYKGNAEDLTLSLDQDLLTTNAFIGAVCETPTALNTWYQILRTIKHHPQNQLIPSHHLPQLIPLQNPTYPLSSHHSPRLLLPTPNPLAYTFLLPSPSPLPHPSSTHPPSFDQYGTGPHPSGEIASICVTSNFFTPTTFPLCRAQNS